MPIEKVNITDDQNAETNVDWLATGERMTEDNLNRPVKQVAQVLNNAIDDIESEFANLTIGTSNALQQEITDRTAADDAEQTARINADNALQSNIDAEIQNRTNADNDLQANIDAEIQERNNADNALQANIDAEIQERNNADDQLLNAINIATAAINQNTSDISKDQIGNGSYGRSKSIILRDSDNIRYGSIFSSIWQYGTLNGNPIGRIYKQISFRVRISFNSSNFAYKTITFPEAFPAGVAPNVLVTPMNKFNASAFSSGGANDTVIVYSIGNSSCNIRIDSNAGTYSGNVSKNYQVFVSASWDASWNSDEKWDEVI